MRNAFLKHILRGSLASSRSVTAPIATASQTSLPFSLSPRRHAVSTAMVEEESETVVFPREGPGVSYGLNWALARRGVIVKDKAFHNLKISELQQNGESTTERISGLPILVKGKVSGGASEISKSQYNKLLKQVTSHISSISNVFVQDGIIGSSPKCDAKVRIISDSSSAVLPFSNVLSRTSTRAVSHDSCPLTVYVSTSISQSAGETVGLGTKASKGFLAVDIEDYSLILCGKAFADASGTKDALAAIAAPLIVARGGIPLSARLLSFGDSVILFFAPENTIQSCSELRDIMVSTDVGVVLSSNGVAPFFRSKDSGAPNLLKWPVSVIFASADSCGALPPVSKLTAGQAAYHFLAGYHDGKFLPAYSKGPSPSDPLELAKALFSELKDREVQSFLLNVNEGGKHLAGKDLVKLIKSTLSKSLPVTTPDATKSKVEDLKGKYKSFMSGKYQELPEEFSF